MRRGNVFRLPLPPTVGGTLASSGQDVKILQEHIVQMTNISNQAFQSLQNRQNTVQQVTAKQPPTVTGFSVTGKQGLFFLTWNRISHVDGYVITQAQDSGMVQLINRFNLPDGDTVAYSIPIGNVAATNSFQVYAYQGPKMSDPSNIVTATSLAYTTPEAAPPLPGIAPRHPKKVPPRVGPNLP
jgi:hypothetical protein